MVCGYDNCGCGFFGKLFSDLLVNFGELSFCDVRFEFGVDEDSLLICRWVVEDWLDFVVIGVV